MTQIKTGDLSKLSPEQLKLFKSLQEIIQIRKSNLSFLKSGEMSEVDVYLMSEKYLKPLFTQYVERPLKTPPEILKKIKEYQQWERRQKLVEDKNKRDNLKIQHALKTKSIFCYQCKKRVVCNSPTYEIRKKKFSTKNSIRIQSICPHCKSKCASFGGYLDKDEGINLNN